MNFSNSLIEIAKKLADNIVVLRSSKAMQGSN